MQVGTKQLEVIGHLVDYDRTGCLSSLMGIRYRHKPGAIGLAGERQVNLVGRHVALLRIKLEMVTPQNLAGVDMDMGHVRLVRGQMRQP